MSTIAGIIIGILIAILIFIGIFITVVILISLKIPKIVSFQLRELASKPDSKNGQDNHRLSDIAIEKILKFRNRCADCGNKDKK